MQFFLIKSPDRTDHMGQIHFPRIDTQLQEILSRCKRDLIDILLNLFYVFSNPLTCSDTLLPGRIKILFQCLRIQPDRR